MLQKKVDVWITRACANRGESMFYNQVNCSGLCLQTQGVDSSGSIDHLWLKGLITKVAVYSQEAGLDLWSSHCQRKQLHTSLCLLKTQVTVTLLTS